MIQKKIITTLEPLVNEVVVDVTNEETGEVTQETTYETTMVEKEKTIYVDTVVTTVETEVSIENIDYQIKLLEDSILNIDKEKQDIIAVKDNKKIEILEEIKKLEDKKLEISKL